MKLRKLVIAALACTSVGAMAAANETSATSTDSSNQGYSSTTESHAGKSLKASSSVQGDNSQISQLQQALNDKGLNAGPVDGRMGPKTKTALKQFQQQNGLTASGRADTQTLAALSINGSSASTDSSSSNSGMSGTNGSTSSSGMSGTNSGMPSSTPSDTNPSSTTNSTYGSPTSSTGTTGMSGTNGSSTSGSTPQANPSQGR